MFIKQFRSHQVRVPDPLRPGKRVFEDRLIPSGAAAVSLEGRVYEADDDGWIEVPHELGAHLLSMRHPGGERFFTPHEVDEQVRLGAVDTDSGDLPARKQRTRSAAK
jgi:hypothetical protein